MQRHWQIVRSYVTRWPFWLCVGIWLAEFIAFVSTRPVQKSMDVLTFAMGFGLIYVNAAIGLQVKEQIGSYRSAIIPGFRGPHLLWACIWTGLSILPIAVAAGIKSLSVVGVLGLGLLIAACAFAAFCRGGWWSGLVLLTFIGIFAAPMTDLNVLLARGSGYTALAALLGLIGAVWYGLTLRYLATLTEESPGYGTQFRSNLRSLQGPQARRHEAAAIQRLDEKHSIWLRIVDWTVPDERVYVGDSRWKRLLHWRRAHANWWFAALMPCLVWSMVTVIQSIMAGGVIQLSGLLPATSWVPILLPQMIILTAWQARVRMLERELTFPVRRDDLITEQGAAILSCQLLSWALLMLEIWAVSRFLPGEPAEGQLYTIMLITGSWQLVAMGLCSRVASTQSALPMVLALMVNCAAGTVVLQTLLVLYTPGMVIGVTGIVVVVGVSLIYWSYSHWLVADIP